MALSAFLTGKVTFYLPHRYGKKHNRPEIAGKPIPLDVWTGMLQMFKSQVLSVAGGYTIIGHVRGGWIENHIHDEFVVVEEPIHLFQTFTGITSDQRLIAWARETAEYACKLFKQDALSVEIGSDLYIVE
jgi:hypothetical protein